MEVKRILFPTDFSSCAKQAFSHAMFHAEAHDADLHIVHSVTWRNRDPTVSMPDPGAITEEMERAAKVMVAEHIELSKDRPFNIIEKTIRGSSPSSVILEYAKQNDIDLIVMGNQGNKGLQRFILGSVAEEVARLSDCPVITVHADANCHLRPIRRILAPMDFSDCAKAAFSRACELAALHGADVLMLHVAQDFYYPGWPDTEIANFPELIEGIRKRRHAAMTEIAESSNVDVKTEIDVSVGGAYQSIVSFAEERNIDLIVIGSRGRSGVAYALLGSVAERVIRLAPCPVYTMKSPPESE